MVFVRADSVEGQQIRAKAHRIANQIASIYAARVGLNIEVHELTPGYLSYSTTQLTPSAMFTIDDNCALVFSGFYNTDTTNGRVIEIKKGKESVTELYIQPIAKYTEDNRGVDNAFMEWGVWKEGEDISYAFKNPAATDNVDAFPIGFVVIPEGKIDIVK